MDSGTQLVVSFIICYLISLIFKGSWLKTFFVSVIIWPFLGNIITYLSNLGSINGISFGDKNSIIGTLGKSVEVMAGPSVIFCFRNIKSFFTINKNKENNIKK